MAQVHQLLNCANEFMILICRVIAKDVHVESRAFLDHCQTDSAGADDSDGFARDLVSEERQEWMP